MVIHCSCKLITKHSLADLFGMVSENVNLLTVGELQIGDKKVTLKCLDHSSWTKDVVKNHVMMHFGRVLFNAPYNGL